MEKQATYQAENFQECKTWSEFREAMRDAFANFWKTGDIFQISVVMDRQRPLLALSSGIPGRKGRPVYRFSYWLSVPESVAITGAIGAEIEAITAGFLSSCEQGERGGNHD